MALKVKKQKAKGRESAKGLTDVDDVLTKINKQYGKGLVRRYTDVVDADIEVISTGSLLLDRALGIGGIPKGRIVEIYGNEMSGKTTMALQCIAECQKIGGVCAFIDAEHALSPAYASALGVSVDDLLITQPDFGEQALNIAEMLTESGKIDLIVIDSVSALVPLAELEGEIGDHHMGLQARMMSQAMRKLTGVVSKSNTTIIFINQIRKKIGVMFGSPDTTSGGQALKFYSSVRLEVINIGRVKKGVDVIGNRLKIKVVKNKLAPPYREIETELVFGKGISKIGEVIDMAVEEDVIEKAGSWYSYGEDRIGQGKIQVLAFLEGDKETLNKIIASLSISK